MVCRHIFSLGLGSREPFNDKNGFTLLILNVINKISMAQSKCLQRIPVSNGGRCLVPWAGFHCTEMADLRPERADFRSERAYFRCERADSRSERADVGPERADVGLERPDFRPERPDFRPERPDFRPERPGGGRTDGQTDGRTDGRMDGRTNEQKSPYVLQDFVPFGAAAQKALKSK